MYKVLWIDDSRTWVESQIEFLADRIEDLGVGLHYDWQEDSEGGIQQSFMVDYDIVLVDYLLVTDNGNVAIVKIRENANNTRLPIIFYSQDRNINLQELLPSDMSRISFCSRDELSEQLINYIVLNWLN